MNISSAAGLMLARALGFVYFRKLYMIYRSSDSRLAKMIINDSGGLPVRDRQVCIVFWDLSGYSRASHLAAVSSAEDQVADFILALFDRIGGVVASHGGILHKYTGDGAIAVFGLESPDTKHAVNEAVEAAIFLRTEIAELMKKTFSFDPDFIEGITSLRCGIHCCVAKYGLARLTHMNTTVLLGHGVNLAARLCDASKNSQILLSEKASKFVSHRHCMSIHGPLNLKNIPEPQWAGCI